jgi:hypothetical protein
MKPFKIVDSGKKTLSKFLNAKSVFLAVNANLRWLNNVAGVYLVQVFLGSYWSAGIGTFLQVSALLPIGRRIVQILCQRRRKATNTAPTTLSAKQAASQSNFINAQLYSNYD